MTEPSPWSRLDEDSTRRREERRVAAVRARERRRVYVVIGLIVLLIAAVVVLVWPRDGDAAERGRGALAIPLVGVLLHPASGAPVQASPAALGTPTGHPIDRPVPILMYHVIHSPPPGAKFPDLYVPPAEFSAQVAALAHAGYRAVTLDQLRSAWKRGTPLPAMPVILTFDDGYRSQAAKAMPVLRARHWPGVLDLQLSLPPSQGGLTNGAIHQLIAAGWEIDAHTIDHLDLNTLDATGLRHEIAGSRQIIRHRFGVPVDWFCYPDGRYDATVEAAVKEAGYVGATTTLPGWASPHEDPYRLPRVRVHGGTQPAALLGEITADRGAPPPGVSFTGAGE
jgi:peptidoglycan/xylan/chitin deacetylase (PgdA/CDA1 family)